MIVFLGITLGVQHVGPSDEGEYTCRAQNAAGTAEALAVLYVRDRVKEMSHLFAYHVIPYRLIAHLVMVWKSL